MTRPTSAVVFGVLNIAFGALGLLCIPFSALPFLSKPGANPVVDITRASTGLLAWTFGSLTLGFFASAVLVVAGIGLLRIASWGRLASIGYAVYAIVAALVGLLVNVICLFPPLLDLAKRSSNPAIQGGVIGGIVGGSVGVCFGLAYPVVLLIFMLRPALKEAFAQAEWERSQPQPPPGQDVPE